MHFSSSYRIPSIDQPIRDQKRYCVETYPTTILKRRNRAGNASRLTIIKPTSKQSLMLLSAILVRQSDHGANVSNETATTLMTIVPTTTSRRWRSSLRLPPQRLWSRWR
jgi:hypothetical protein